MYTDWTVRWCTCFVSYPCRSYVQSTFIVLWLLIVRMQLLMPWFRTQNCCCFTDIYIWHAIFCFVTVSVYLHLSSSLQLRTYCRCLIVMVTYGSC